jgi:hypothetical protein
MSISVNYILQEAERKKKQAQTAPIPTPEEAVSQDSGGIVPQGAIERRIANHINSLNQQRQQQIQQSQQQQATAQQSDNIDYSRKPAGWSDDEYRAIRQIYSDDQIQQSLAQPNPDDLVQGIYTQLIKSSIPQPKAPDEKAMKRQRAIAAIGDVLGLVSQAVAGSQGAINQPRSFDQSAYGQLSKKQQEVYDRYVEDADRYSSNIINAQMKDYLAGIQDWKQTQANIAKALSDYRDYQIDVAKQAQDAAYKQAVLEDTRKRTDAYIKDLEEQARDRKRRTDIAAQTASQSAARTQAYIENLKSSTRNSAGEKVDYQLVIPAAENDPTAETDQFGNRIKRFGVSSGEIDLYARQALSDEDFLRNHSEFSKTSGQSYTADEKRNIAATYLQEKYNQQFVQPTIDPAVKAGGLLYGQGPDVKQAPAVNSPKQNTEKQITPGPKLDEAELDEMFQIIY